MGHPESDGKPSPDPERPDPEAGKRPDAGQNETAQGPTADELGGVSTVPKGGGGDGKHPSGGAGYDGPQGDEVDPGTD